MSCNLIRIGSLATTKGSPGMLPVSPATIWRWIRAGILPPPIRLGPNTCAWDVAEIEKFIATRTEGGAA